MAMYSLFMLGMFFGSVIIPIMIAIDSSQVNESDRRVQNAYESTSFMKR